MGAGLKSRRCFYSFFAFVFAVLVVAAAVITIRKKSHHSESSPIPGPPGAITKKYADALKVAMKFLDVQKSGKLANNKISWRGDSAIHDGKEEDLDLSKGMYDAGDHMKFGFPMAFTATMLSWSILEYGDQMDAVKQLEPAQDSLKWMTDYLINAHPSDNVLYIQVGDPELDHKCWERPENMKERRPLIQVNASSPGTEVAAETAAALASASLVFKTVNSTYSNLLLKHAQQLFSFADTYRGSYSISVPQVQKYYNSTGYNDELLWAATWLYHATEDQSYLEYVTKQNGKAFGNWEDLSWFSWDNKHTGTQLLLSRVILFGAKKTSNEVNLGLQIYREKAEAVMCILLPDSSIATSSRTDSQLSPLNPSRLRTEFLQMSLWHACNVCRDLSSVQEQPLGGLLWMSEWNSLQHPVAAAFLAVLYSDYMLSSRTKAFNCNDESYTPADLRKFAVSQADYVLGDNPMKMSYLVGYGSSYPQYVHHRGASIPDEADTGCKEGWKWLESTAPNPNVAIGALVGGPFLNETYIDSRNNSMQGEPTTYNSALAIGLLSALVTRSSVVPSFL